MAARVGKFSGSINTQLPECISISLNLKPLSLWEEEKQRYRSSLVLYSTSSTCENLPPVNAHII